MAPQSKNEIPPPDSDHRPVVVIGSANVDVSVTATTLPRPGETVTGTGSMISVGGKGANQAVAAASAGAPTRFVGCVGDDAFGSLVRAALTDRGVNIDELEVRPGSDTGLAAIYVDAAGQNSIVVVPGANAAVQPGRIERLTPLVSTAAVIVLQGEIPLATNRRAIEVAAAAGTPVILNPAPCAGLVLAQLPAGVSYLVPNETEAAALSGLPVGNVAEARACASALRGTGIDCVIITLGAAGCVIADAAGARHEPAVPVNAIDTTGAGDAFVGCFAAGLATGRPRDTAVREAMLYAALSTTRRGAQASYPSAKEFAAHRPGTHASRNT